MNGWQFATILTAIFICGALILERLPKPKRHKDFAYESRDGYVTFRIETVLEDDFKVEFIDGWETGRGFSLYGSVIPRDNDKSSDEPAFGERTGVKIGVSSDWFQSSRIGGIRVYDRGGCDCFIALPFQIARSALEEVRRDPDQLVTLGFKRAVGKNGKPSFSIYSFELSKPLD